MAKPKDKDKDIVELKRKPKDKDEGIDALTKKTTCSRTATRRSKPCARRKR